MPTNEDSTEEPRQERLIDAIPTEKSAIKRALDATIPLPQCDDGLEIRHRKEIARDQQKKDRERQIKRYQPAIMAYLGAYLKDSDATSAVWDRLVEKWLEGKLGSYDKSRSFRKYIKTVLRHEVYAYWREIGKQAAQPVVSMDPEFEHSDPLQTTASEAFNRKVRDDIIQGALDSVRDTDSLYHQTLKVLMSAVASGEKSPSSRELAAILTERGKATISEDNARQIKKRAREMFSRLVVKKVGTLIDSDDLSKIEQALRDWNLIAYCEKALRKMRGADAE